jgi:hypothetical protein
MNPANLTNLDYAMPLSTTRITAVVRAVVALELAT